MSLTEIASPSATAVPVRNRPKPWRAAPRFSELDQVTDARGRVLCVCEPDVAAYIVALANRDNAP